MPILAFALKKYINQNQLIMPFFLIFLDRANKFDKFMQFTDSVFFLSYIDYTKLFVAPHLL